MTRSRPTRVLLAILVVATFVIPTSAAVAQRSNTTASLVESIERPQRVLDVLTNARRTIENGLILRPDFYTDDNLKHVFGGDRVAWNQGSRRELSGTVADYDKILSVDRISPKIHKFSASLSFSREVEGDRVSVLLDFLVLDEQARLPSFADIESIFGTHWSDIQPLPAQPPRQFATAPHGNAQISYREQYGAIVAGLYFVFLPDGRLREAIFDCRGF
jgi:hypothetical protein